MKSKFPFISKINPKIKNKFAVLEITKDSLKIIYFNTEGEVTKISDLKEIDIASYEKDNERRIFKAFQQLDKNCRDIIISIPRGAVTIRSIKLPSQDEQELQSMASLQATKFLPYNKEELVVGCQIIRFEQGGYSRLFLILLHKNIIEGYLKASKTKRININGIYVSSFGLLNWLRLIYPPSDSKEAELILEVDNFSINLIIADGKSLLFSRSFSFSYEDSDWKQKLIDNIRISLESYSRELIGSYPKDVVLTGILKNLKKIENIIMKELGATVKIVYPFDISSSFAAGFNIDQSKLNSSFSHLIGMGLLALPSSTNLIEKIVQAKREVLIKKKEFVKLGVYISCIILILFLIIFKTVSLKLSLLNELKTSLKEISPAAAKLKEMQAKIDIVKSNFFTKPTGADLIFELYKIIPQEVKLESIVYDRSKQLILKGFTQDNAYVTKLISILNSSNYFYGTKLDYATKKGKGASQFTVFRIVCPFITKKE